MFARYRFPLRWLNVAFFALAGATGSRAYDPLQVPRDASVRELELRIPDPGSGRDLSVRVHVPSSHGKYPVVLFSHGLGGSNKGGAYLSAHWAARGYVAVFLQHPGSDEAVWKDVPIAERVRTLQGAASGQNLAARVEDVHRVIDQLAVWNAQADHPLSGKLDLGAIGMSGHSFGAVTTQAVSGQSQPMLGTRWVDSRIRAAVAMSPSSPRFGNPAAAFAAVQIPWMLMTGTLDTSPIGGAGLESRLGVYPHLPASIPRYELVLDGAHHSAFSDRAPPRGDGPRNPNHHRAILALSTAFWDAHLRGDAEARTWLHGDGARSVLQAADRWQWQPAAGAAR